MHFRGVAMAGKSDEQYGPKEAQARFEAALRSALKTPHKSLKEKPKVKRGKPKKRAAK
jgi:hypothetical protein